MLGQAFFVIAQKSSEVAKGNNDIFFAYAMNW